MAFRIGFVGDCSQNDETLLGRALDAALASSDVVVQVGDINSKPPGSNGYEAVKARLGTGKLFPVPGNHDTGGPGDWGLLPNLPKQWRRDYPAATLIGLDNSTPTLDQANWDLLAAYGKNPPKAPLFVFMHMALSPLILPDGTESTHIMGEGSQVHDGERLKGWLTGLTAAVCCGHYHGASVMQASYATVILDGRGGSQGYFGKPVCGWTQILVQPEGWTAHQYDLLAP